MNKNIETDPEFSSNYESIDSVNIGRKNLIKKTNADYENEHLQQKIKENENINIYENSRHIERIDKYNLFNLNQKSVNQNLGTESTDYEHACSTTTNSSIGKRFIPIPEKQQISAKNEGSLTGNLRKGVLNSKTFARRVSYDRPLVTHCEPINLKEPETIVNEHDQKDKDPTQLSLYSNVSDNQNDNNFQRTYSNNYGSNPYLDLDYNSDFDSDSLAERNSDPHIKHSSSESLPNELLAEDDPVQYLTDYSSKNERKSKISFKINKSDRSTSHDNKARQNFTNQSIYQNVSNQQKYNGKLQGCKFNLFGSLKINNQENSVECNAQSCGQTQQLPTSKKILGNDYENLASPKKRNSRTMSIDSVLNVNKKKIMCRTISKPCFVNVLSHVKNSPNFCASLRSARGSFW